jgi:hypothetical protein
MWLWDLLWRILVIYFFLFVIAHSQSRWSVSILPTSEHALYPR